MNFSQGPLLILKWEIGKNGSVLKINKILVRKGNSFIIDRWFSEGRGDYIIKCVSSSVCWKISMLGKNDQKYYLVSKNRDSIYY